MQAPAPELVARLRVAFPTPAGLPFNLSAALWSLAGCESRWVLGLVGDDGTSFGMWQVNGRGRVPASSDPVGSEIDFIRPDVEEKMRAVVQTLGIMLERMRRGDRPILNDASVRDWLNIAWQFGPEALTSWGRRSDRRDYRGVAWVDEMKPNPVSGFTAQDYLNRLEEFEAFYRVAASIPLER